MSQNWKKAIQSYDDRRDIIIPGNAAATVQFSVEQFIEIAKEAIQDHDYFAVALSGGQTPHAIFKELSNPSYHTIVDWSKVFCFWSDERSVPPDNSENNFYSAMEAGLNKLPLKRDHIFRMVGEDHIEDNALAYERLIKEKIPSGQFDLMMLGMGEDGHTASLFPFTHGLQVKERLIIANHIPQKETWRMSVTFDCINHSKNINIYAMGAKKGDMIREVLTSPYNPDQYPVQKVGTPQHKALWILDDDAAKKIIPMDIIQTF